MTKQLLTARAKWLWRAWPLFVPAFIGAVHYFVWSFCHHPPLLNKMVSASLQVIGGAILLYSINQNMGTFRGHTFKTLALNWIKSYPSSRISGIANMTATAAIAMGMGSVTFSAKRQCTTLEEKLEDLQRQIDETARLVHEKERLLNQALDKTRTELQASLSQHGTELRRVSTLLSETVVGGFKSQLFGGLLVMYGAVLSVFV